MSMQLWAEAHQTWLMLGALALALTLIFGGPFLGFMVIRRDKRYAGKLAADNQARGRVWHESFANLHEDLREPIGKALYLTGPIADPEPLQPGELPGEPEPDTNEEGPSVDGEPTEAFEAYSGERLIRWDGERTQEWSVVDVLEAEEDLPETQAEKSWMADPLFSTCYAPDWAVDNAFPKAKEAFDSLVSLELLTGDGSDIDVEWAAWNLYDSRELVPA